MTEPRLCLARVFLSWHPELMLLHFCFNGAIRPLSDNPDWMERDTRAKARLCLLLYGIFLPIILIMSYVSANGVVKHTPYDLVIGVGATISIILTVVACFQKWRRYEGTLVNRIAMTSWVFPLVAFIWHFIEYKDVI